jgi:hypothetical protein
MEQRSLFHNVSDGVSNIALFCEVPSSYSLRSPVQHFRVCTQIVTWLTCIDDRLHASGLEYTLALGDLQLQILSFATMVSYKSYCCKMKTRKNT